MILADADQRGPHRFSRTRRINSRHSASAASPRRLCSSAVISGILQRSWCIIPGDPPGTYTYNITIDGEPRGEFVFCAIEMPDQNPNVDPRDLNCPNKFNSVNARPFSPRKAS